MDEIITVFNFSICKVIQAYIYKKQRKKNMKMENDG